MKRLMWFCSVLVLFLFTRLQGADCSVLLDAAVTGDYAIVHEYCSVGYDPTNQNPPTGTLFVDGIDGDGNTPIALAAMQGHYSIVERLIAAGARLNIVNHKRETPLMHAAKNGDDRMAQILFNAGALVNIQDTKGRMALIHAAKKGCMSTVILLKIVGAEVSLQDAKGQNALMHAAKQGHVDIVQMLKHAGVDINAVSSDGMTALMYAAQYGHEAVVHALINLGADTALKSSAIDRDAAGIATLCGWPAIATMLYAAMGIYALDDMI
ncbi:ankyrin repeat domain-containing protein [Candidatus Dependentiae bacterium]|nr:ankyrin repeat domain-containing protein [Candidatus Dependentiae bacterium]